MLVSHYSAISSSELVAELLAGPVNDSQGGPGGCSPSAKTQFSLPSECSENTVCLGRDGPDLKK